jgi:glycosyltransferase involved in cell wall biosynthesis
METNPKIYYIAHCRFPSERAHAVQIAKMVEAMRLSGTDVELVVPKRKNEITKTPKEFYGLKTDIPVHYVPVIDSYGWGKFGYLVGGLSFIRSYMSFIREKKRNGEKFTLYTIDMDQFSFIGVSSLGLPFTMEVHDSKKYGWFFNRMFTRARKILTINNIIKRELVQNFKLPPEKILVHPNGIDIELFSQDVDREAWRKKWNIALEKPLVLYVGKCYDWKGLDIFDEAFKALPEVNFAFVGCTKEEVEKVTGKKSDYPNALYFGQQPYADMPKWMKSADILLVIGTKKNEYSYLHTSPMKLFEYMPTGVPILSVGTPAVKDQVTESEVFFYEPDNAQSFIFQIQKILDDKTLAQKVAVTAKTSAQKFSWGNRARLIAGTN